MLIDSPRLRPGDREAWERWSDHDRAWAKTPRYRERVEEAEMVLVRFARKPAYAGVSWGKDSTVLAHLVVTLVPDTPLVHLRCEPIDNPDCAAVRDAFLRAYPHARYEEITVQCRIDSDGVAHATGTLERGFAEANTRYGDRYLSGIRAAESSVRKLRLRAHGIETGRTCAPLSRWDAQDVWAYLATHELPVHPAYAMTMGGALNRDTNRVAWIGLTHGLVYGRREWEERYYGDVLIAARATP